MRCQKCGQEKDVSRYGLAFWCAECTPVWMRKLDAIFAPGTLADTQRVPAGTEPAGVGEIVLYTLGNGPSAGQQRPAIVLAPMPTRSEELGVLLHVFTCEGDGLVDHKTEALYSAAPRPWFWTRRPDGHRHLPVEVKARPAPSGPTWGDE